MNSRLYDTGRKTRNMPGFGCAASVLLLGLIIIALWSVAKHLDANKSREEMTSGELFVHTLFTRSSSPTPAHQSTPIPDVWEDAAMTTAADLDAEYDRNEVAANDKFMNKRIIVTGYVQDIVETRLGIMVYLQGRSRYEHVICHPKSGERENVARIEKRQHITVRGKSTGMTLGSPQISDCEIVSVVGGEP